MVEIPDPTQQVLTRAAPEAVEQPRPPDPHYGTRDGAVPVVDPCPACSCRWVTDPTAVSPEGSVHCGYCRAMRGYLHRDANLAEFTDGAAPSLDADSTIDYRWAADSPFLGWRELRVAARECVQANPTTDYVTELMALAHRPPYCRQVYLANTLTTGDETWTDPADQPADMRAVPPGQETDHGHAAPTPPELSR